MISPVYTPFSGSEVIATLGITDVAYNRAVEAKTLGKSVHFEIRVSDRTAMHSLVDIVKFAALAEASSQQLSQVAEAIVDDLLDDICCLSEQEGQKFEYMSPKEIEVALIGPYVNGWGCASLKSQYATLIQIVSRVWVECSTSLSKEFLEK